MKGRPRRKVEKLRDRRRAVSEAARYFRMRTKSESSAPASADLARERELYTKHIALPRGCVAAAVDLLVSNGIRPELRDERYCGTPLGTRFLETLSKEQQRAADALMAHDSRWGLGAFLFAAELL
jgi:hypothetical protein